MGRRGSVIGAIFREMVRSADRAAAESRRQARRAQAIQSRAIEREMVRHEREMERARIREERAGERQPLALERETASRQEQETKAADLRAWKPGFDEHEEREHEIDRIAVMRRSWRIATVCTASWPVSGLSKPRPSWLRRRIVMLALPSCQRVHVRALQTMQDPVMGSVSRMLAVEVEVDYAKLAPLTMENIDLLLASENFESRINVDRNRDLQPLRPRGV